MTTNGYRVLNPPVWPTGWAGQVQDDTKETGCLILDPRKVLLRAQQVGNDYPFTAGKYFGV